MIREQSSNVVGILFILFLGVAMCFSMTAMVHSVDGASVDVTYNDNYSTESLQLTESRSYHNVYDVLWDRSGYIFTKWNTSPDGTGTSYYPFQKISVSSALNLYAQWISAEESFVIRYYSNGGSSALNYESLYDTLDAGIRIYGEYVELTFPTGATHQILSNAFTHQGKEFVEWQSSSGRPYYPGNNVTMTKNFDLYAQWAAPTITVNAGTAETFSGFISDLELLLGYQAGIESASSAFRNKSFNVCSGGAQYVFSSEEPVESAIQKCFEIIYNDPDKYGFETTTVFPSAGTTIETDTICKISSEDAIMSCGESTTNTITVKGGTTFIIWSQDGHGITRQANGTSLRGSLSLEDGSTLIVAGTSAEPLPLNGGADTTWSEYQSDGWYYYQPVSSIAAASPIIDAGKAEIYMTHVNQTYAFSTGNMASFLKLMGTDSTNKAQLVMNNVTCDQNNSGNYGFIYTHYAAAYITDCTFGLAEDYSLDSYKKGDTTFTYKRAVGVENKLVGNYGINSCAYFSYTDATVLGGEIRGNETKKQTGDYWSSASSTLYADNSKVYIDGDLTFSKNCSYWGSLFAKGSEVSIYSLSFENNVNRHYGGLITSSSSSSVWILGGHYINVYTKYGGGLIYCRDSGQGLCVGLTIDGGFAGGGSVTHTRIKSNSLLMGCKIMNCDNYVCGSIGASLAGSITLINVEISDCKGSAISVASSGPAYAEIRLYNTQIEGCSDSAINSTAYKVYITNCEISRCTSDNGGALHLIDSDVEIRNSVIRDNSATESGGGIYTTSATRIIDSIVEDNTAPLGPQAYINSANTKILSIEGGRLVGGTYVGISNVTIGSSKATSVTQLSVMTGTITLGPNAKTQSVSLDSGSVKISSGTDLSGLDIGSGNLYMVTSSEAYQVTVGESSNLYVNEVSISTLTSGNIYNLIVDDEGNLVADTYLGKIGAVLNSTQSITLTLTASSGISTVEGITDANVLILGEWENVGSTYTCSATVVGEGATEVRVQAPGLGYYNVYITLSSVILNTPISTITTTGHPSATEGETYQDLGTSGTTSFGYLKMYESSNNAAAGSTSLQLPILADAESTFIGWRSGSETHTWEEGDEYIAFNAGSGQRIVLTALWLNGSSLNMYGIFYEFDSNTNALRIYYDPSEVASGASPIFDTACRTALVSEEKLGGRCADVSSLEIEGITHLCQEAFATYFPSLVSVTLDATEIQAIGHDAFRGCAAGLEINSSQIREGYTPILNADMIAEATTAGGTYASNRIQLINNVALENNILSIDTDTTIDLNGCWVTGVAAGVAQINLDSELTILDSQYSVVREGHTGGGFVSSTGTYYEKGSLTSVVADAKEIAYCDLQESDLVFRSKIVRAGADTLLDPHTELHGKKFIGWSTSKEGPITYSDQNYIVSVSTNLILHALFSEYGYQASYQG